MPNEPQQIMVTSNDSRIRVYQHYALICKYKGLHNANTQIKASFSQDGSYIICGSDDGNCVVWNNIGAGKQEVHPSAPLDHVAEKCGSYESFQAHNEIQTIAIFAPDSLQRILRQEFQTEAKVRKFPFFTFIVTRHFQCTLSESIDLNLYHSLQLSLLCLCHKLMVNFNLPC